MNINTETCLRLNMQYFADAADSQEDEEQAADTQENRTEAVPAEKDGLPKTQEELNAMIEKRLKRERRKMEHQQTGAVQGQQETQTAEQGLPETNALDAVNRELMIARAQLEAYKSGVMANAVEDAVYLAVMQAEKAGELDEEGVRDALKEVLKRRPEWRAKKDETVKGVFKIGVDASEAGEKAKGKGLPKGKVIF